MGVLGFCGLRNQSLDVLRGIAILLVIGLHFNLPGPFRVGGVGVDLFFVLSGFLISGLLFRDYQLYGRIQLRRFWIRRAFKILPPLFFFLAVMSIFISKFAWRGLLASALFCLNYFPTLGVPGIGHTWSLGVEEQFYLTLPLLLACLAWSKTNPFRSLPIIAVAIAITCFIFRLTDPHYEFTHLRVDALFLGVALRYFYDFKHEAFIRAAKPWLLVPGILFWLPEFLLIHRYQFGFDRSIMFASTDLLAGCLLAAAIAQDQSRFWRWAPFRLLARIGFYSYSIYLWQQPTAMLFNSFHHSVLMTACGFMAALAVGIIMAKLIEVPFLRLRDRLSPALTGRYLESIREAKTASIKHPDLVSAPIHFR